MQEFKGISGSVVQLIAVYLNLGVEPKVAREAAKIVIRERAGDTRDRTQAEKITMDLAYLQMKLAKRTAQKELIEKGLQLLEGVRESHKLARSPHPDFGTAAHTKMAKAVRID